MFTLLESLSEFSLVSMQPFFLSNSLKMCACGGSQNIYVFTVISTETVLVYSFVAWRKCTCLKIAKW